MDDRSGHRASRLATGQTDPAARRHQQPVSGRPTGAVGASTVPSTCQRCYLRCSTEQCWLTFAGGVEAGAGHIGAEEAMLGRRRRRVCRCRAPAVVEPGRHGLERPCACPPGPASTTASSGRGGTPRRPSVSRPRRGGGPQERLAFVRTRPYLVEIGPVRYIAHHVGFGIVKILCQGQLFTGGFNQKRRFVSNGDFEAGDADLADRSGFGLELDGRGLDRIWLDLNATVRGRKPGAHTETSNVAVGSSLNWNRPSPSVQTDPCCWFAPMSTVTEAPIRRSPVVAWRTTPSSILVRGPVMSVGSWPGGRSHSSKRHVAPT